MKMLRLWWFFVVGILCAMATSLQCAAQPYPGRPLRMVVPAAAGSPTDIMARTIGTKLAESLGQPVVVENHPGPGGMIAFNTVAKAPADGYTMVLGDINALQQRASDSLGPLNLAKSYTPVSLVAQMPIVLLIDNSLRIKSVRELVDFLKAKPNQLAYSYSGPSSQGHLAGEQFKRLTKTSIREVPYVMDSAAGAALLRGDVQMTFAPLTAAKALARDGKARILAITGDKRSKLDPEFPTFSEAGLPGFDVGFKFGVLLPPDAPREIVTRLNAEIVKIVNTSDAREQFAKIGAEPVGTTPEQLVALAHIEAGKWTMVLKEASEFGSSPAAAPKATSSMEKKAEKKEGVKKGASSKSTAPQSPSPVAAAPQPVAAIPQPVAAAPPLPPPPPAPTMAIPKPPPPAVAVAGQKGQIEDAYWNSRFERDGEPVRALEIGEVFTFILDLSQYQYQIGQSAGVDPETRRKLKEAIDLNQKQISFVIHPILVGGVLEFAGEPPSRERMPVELDRLLVKQAGAAENQLLAKYRNGALRLADFAQATRAGTFKFDVLAKLDGCASIALSIWDESGQFPLDNLIHTVTVGAGPGDGTTCGKDGAALHGGLATLLSPSLDRGPGASDSIDAALHIFEFQHGRTSKRTVAVLVDKLRYQAAQGDATIKDRGVYAWQLESTLSDYLAKPGEMLSVVNSARAQANNAVDDAYSAVAEKLKLKLFSGVEKQDQVAKLALAALQETVRNAKQPPVIVVRMYSVDNDPIYLPLGLLGARAKNRVLSQPVTLIQPLPRERYVSGKTCIEPWTFGIPQKLSGEGDIDMTAVAPVNLAGGEERWLRSLENFLAWLAPGEPEEATKPEGLLLLAHQADGNLWFESQEKQIVREQVNRKFSAGSVAVLSACSMGSPQGDNSIILKKLNQNGMDAMIVSPFPVRADYGIRLARNMVSVIHAERLAGRTPTVAELFKAAAALTATDLEKYKAKLDEMSLEFLILGDYNMRLCKR